MLIGLVAEGIFIALLKLSRMGQLGLSFEDEISYAQAIGLAIALEVILVPLAAVFLFWPIRLVMRRLLLVGIFSYAAVVTAGVGTSIVVLCLTIPIVAALNGQWPEAGSLRSDASAVIFVSVHVSVVFILPAIVHSWWRICRSSPDLAIACFGGERSSGGQNWALTFCLIAIWELLFWGVLT